MQVKYFACQPGHSNLADQHEKQHQDLMGLSLHCGKGPGEAVKKSNICNEIAKGSLGGNQWGITFQVSYKVNI